MQEVISSVVAEFANFGIFSYAFGIIIILGIVSIIRSLVDNA